MSDDYETLVQKLQLERHPEGGWYREVYRAGETISPSCLPERFSGGRAFSTAIYFLLGPGDFSALHRIQQDELWHFYAGTSLTIHIIDVSGDYRTLNLGCDIPGGDQPLAVVEAASWFGATVNDPTSYSLVGCTVAPGFDFADFELPSRDELLERFPQHEALIRRLAK